MRHFRYASFACGLTVAALVTVWADDSATPRALVDKAIQAHGGEATLSKLSAVTATFKGTYHGTGQAVPLTGELAAHGPDRRKLVVDVEAGGQTLRLIHVVNGDKAWVKFSDSVVELDKERLAEAKAEAYSDWVATLTPLKGNGFMVALVGETSIDKRPALGIKVSKKDCRDVDLYFDKETSLLVKTESRVVDDNGQEVTEETFLSDYKESQGAKHAMKFIIKRDDKLYLEGAVTEYQFAEKLDDAVFAKP